MCHFHSILIGCEINDPPVSISCPFPLLPRLNYVNVRINNIFGHQLCLVSGFVKEEKYERNNKGEIDELRF